MLVSLQTNTASGARGRSRTSNRSGRNRNTSTSRQSTHTGLKKNGNEKIDGSLGNRLIFESPIQAFPARTTAAQQPDRVTRLEQSRHHLLDAHVPGIVAVSRLCGFALSELRPVLS